MLYKRRLLSLKQSGWKLALCVLYRKIRMRVTRMTMCATCHCKMHVTCSRRERSLQLGPSNGGAGGVRTESERRKTRERKMKKN